MSLPKKIIEGVVTIRIALRLNLVKNTALAIAIAAVALAIIECVINAPVIRAQSERSARTRPEPKFGVEIPNSGYPSDYVTLDGPGIVATYPTVNLKRTTGGSPQGHSPTELRLEYQVEEDSVVITASFVFGDSPVVFDGSQDPPRQRVGVYSAKMDQAVLLAEMTRFGFEPLAVRIVPAKPELSVTSAASPRPQTISKAPSIQMEIIGEDQMRYKVVLHNLSGMTVTAFSIFTPSADGNGGGGLSSELGSRDAIAPGTTHQVLVGIANGGRMLNGVFVPDPPPTQMILEAVFYRDGSYEGDVRAASEIGARRIGAGIQRQRVDQLVEGILSDDQSSDRAKVARIRAEADRLTEDPDQQMVDRVRSEFPGLSEEAIERAKSTLKGGLRSEKTRLASELKQFEGREPGFQPLSLAMWWSERLRSRTERGN
jgi:hypothetical protein